MSVCLQIKMVPVVEVISPKLNTEVLSKQNWMKNRTGRAKSFFTAFG